MTHYCPHTSRCFSPSKIRAIKISAMEASVAVALVFLLTKKIDQNFDKSPHTHQKFDRLVKNLTIRQKISNGFDPSKFWFKPIFDIKTSYTLSNFLSKYWCQNFDAKFWRFFWTCMGPFSRGRKGEEFGCVSRCRVCRYTLQSYKGFRRYGAVRLTQHMEAPVWSSCPRK